MEKKSMMRKMSAAVLVGTVLLSGMLQFSRPVYAQDKQTNELPTKGQFVTVDELKSFDTNDQNGKNSASVIFGDESWKIAGSQNGNLTLFSAVPLVEDTMFENDWENYKSYSPEWECDYTSTGGSIPTDVYANHYGASPVRNILKDLETSNFTNAEQALMNETTIYTDDLKNNSVYSTTNKLYLPYGNVGDEYITVGANSPDNLSSGLRIENKYIVNRGIVWLRTPNHTVNANAAHSYSPVYGAMVVNEYNLAPAFELNLSEALFGSSLRAVKKEGKIDTSLDLYDFLYTIRYQPQNSIGTATISQSKQSVAVTGITNDNTYLVAQNKDGAWAKKVSANDAILASEMGDDFTSFENCEVWLETTNERVTYASKATQGTGYNVQITAGENMLITSNNGIQTNILGSIENVIVKANDGFMFPADYAVEEQNGITVTRDSENQITVLGTPTADVNMVLPQATKKVYDINFTGSGTFTTVCESYQSVTPKEFTITNNGNSDLMNVDVSIIGNDADKFELNWNKTIVIQPKETITVTVKPKDNLSVNTYQATLSVSADNVNTVATDLQFTVSAHDYESVVTPPTCTEKGYTVYTCKNCSHSYIGNEIEAKGHTFGEWEVIKNATITETGIRERHCERCDYTETEVIPMISKPVQPNDNNADNDEPTNNENPETGDSTNAILFISMFTMSVLGIVALVIWKKKKVLEYK